jgi:hypothetical protein
MSSYKYIREEVVQGVIRSASQARNPAVPPPLDRIRAQFDAAFFSINSQTAQAYAARENQREMLRVARTLTFVSGDAAVPTDTLKSYINDCTLTVTGKKYSFRRYPQWLRTGDTRLGYWTEIGDTLKAKIPATGTAFSGTASFSSIESPEVPTDEDDEFDCPDDYLPDFEAAMIQYIIGQTMEVAAQTA